MNSGSLNASVDNLTENVTELDIGYLLVKDHSAFKRCDLVQWYFDHFLGQKSLEFFDDKQDHRYQENIIIVHGLARDGYVVDFEENMLNVNNGFDSEGVITQVASEGIKKSDAIDTNITKVVLGPTSQIDVLFCSYRIVFCLDVSPSCTNIDPTSGEILFEQLYICVQKCIIRLFSQSMVFEAVGGTFKYCPQIYLSVIAQGTLLETFEVLLQGAFLTKSTAKQILIELKQKLNELEKKIFQVYSKSNSYENFSLDLESNVTNGLLALKLLPKEARPSLVFVTDGVTSLRESTMYDNISMLLNRDDIPFSIIHAYYDFQPHCAFGFVPDIAMHQFLAKSTQGFFMDLNGLTPQKKLNITTSYEDDEEEYIQKELQHLLLGTFQEYFKPKYFTKKR